MKVVFMVPVNVLIGLQPPPKTYQRIRALRKEIQYQNYFQGSEPHITLYVNTFSNVSEIENKVNEVIQHHAPFQAKVRGIHCFGYDPFTTQHTLVYLLEKTPELVSLQKDLVERLAPLRTNDLMQECLQRNPSEEQKENLRKYGYLFGPEDWDFHATIGSFPEQHIDEIMKVAKNYDEEEWWLVDKVNMYLKHAGEGHKRFFYKTFTL